MTKNIATYTTTRRSSAQSAGVWLYEVEGDFTSVNCEHLRFTLHSECSDDFEYFGEWDAEGFIRLLEDAR